MEEFTPEQQAAIEAEAEKLAKHIKYSQLPQIVELMKAELFPKREAALQKLGDYRVVQVHDDGDLTVESGGKTYVVTTDGATFVQQQNPVQSEDIEVIAGTVLLLHSVPEAEGLGAIITDEARLKSGPCTCYGNVCFHKGAIGALSKSERGQYCAEVVEKTSPAMTERLKKWNEAKDVCKGQIEGLPKGEKLVPYLQCMGIELPRRGIEI